MLPFYILSALYYVRNIYSSFILTVTIREEYCEYENFIPNCADNEVVLITEATYGRMKLGKCIPGKYSDDLGCSANVINFLSQKCSGQRSCFFRIRNLVMDHEGNCPPSAIRSYLEVAYTCLKGKIYVFRDV